MNNDDRSSDVSESAGPAPIGRLSHREDARQTLATDQASSASDQSAADADQTLSDADQTASTMDQAIADSDQRASDRDQASANWEHDAGPNLTQGQEDAFIAARRDRETVTSERIGNRLTRARASRDREATARRRDRIAEDRDAAGRTRDERGTDLARLAAAPDSSLLEQLEQLAAQAAADRARAAEDRKRAAKDRANAARQRARLEKKLRLAHLDELTGAYRREMGRLALTHEIARARRSDGRFVVAFVDVDRLKEVNDRDGHAAGDRLLQTVADAIRLRLRSFDPFIRYGGDEFVCGLGGTDLLEAQRRFESIGASLKADAKVGISVGLATLQEGDTADLLTERADAAMLEVKAVHHTRR